MGVSERIGAFVDGLSTFLIGVVMVFLALALLILLIQIVGRVVKYMENRRVASVVTQTEITPPIASLEPISEIEMQNEESELELVAVITAAIAASLGTTSDQLQVRSLRKVDRRARTFE